MSFLYWTMSLFECTVHNKSPCQNICLSKVLICLLLCCEDLSFSFCYLGISNPLPCFHDWVLLILNFQYSTMLNHHLSQKFVKDVYFLFGDRYLVPREMSVGQFIHILSSRLHLDPGKALFVFVKNTLPQTGIFAIESCLACLELILLQEVFSVFMFWFALLWLWSAATFMDSVYGSFKDEDGFLYMCYSTEKAFGYATNHICLGI